MCDVEVLISETLVKEVSKDAGLHLPLKTLMVTLGDKEELARLIQERIWVTRRAMVIAKTAMALVVDNGSGMCKMPGIMVGMDQKDLSV
ncbi:hypothetical protein AK812_SmicGene26251 [Symbiodinium microadriaticum]|uniref:Uncharacterized protein n=1 Tax=Symbiodinium microadriaticum TaxID=2951 RepID=A0A1Q9D9W8_SYMMI|nr:hypothetical protein AK812_SmicGene26251 [Symbiodinium microadriaticum]